MFHGFRSITKSKNFPTDWCSTDPTVPSDGEKVVRRRLVEFLEFNSIHKLKSVQPDAEKVVRRRLVECLVFHAIYLKTIGSASAGYRVLPSTGRVVTPM